MNRPTQTLAPFSPAAADDFATPEAMLDAVVAEGLARGASAIHFDPLPAGGTSLAFRCPQGVAFAWQLRVEESAALSAFVAARSEHVGDRPGLSRRGTLPSSHGLLRVATLATEFGERIVVHLATADRQGLDLRWLGMPPATVDVLRPALAEDHGLVLVAGSARSGRSTTLDALLRHLAGAGRRVIRIGPLDGATLPGVTRVAAGEAGVAIWQAIAAVRDQDADVIVVDGIDGRQAATVAVEAAEAGLLVIASVAAANALAAIQQLRAWRLDPFQLASSLRVVLAQRLVRALCPECREPVQAQGSTSALLGFDPGSVVYAPVGCEACGGTGYAGRTGVFEAIAFDGALRRLINDGGDAAILARHAFLRAPDLGSAARALVREGVTTPDEAVRLSRS